MLHDIEAHRQILAAGHRGAYQAAVILAALLGGALVRRDSRAWAMAPGRRAMILSVVAVGGLAGCAVPAFFAGGTIQETARSLLLAPKTILGGLLGGFFAVALFKRLTGDRADTSDAFARGAVVMMLVGRLGCIAQHCCYGRPAGWGIDLGDGVLRVPVQHIETAGLLVIAGLCQWLHATDRLRGRRLFTLFVAYGALRFGLEFLRAPVARSLWGIGFYQWIAVLLGGVGLHQVLSRGRVAR